MHEAWSMEFLIRPLHFPPRCLALSSSVSLAAFDWLIYLTFCISVLDLGVQHHHEQLFVELTPKTHKATPSRFAT